ncbi:hypothetical protein GcC1_136018 [Golovinomyces cichoracearum]|uniref:Uncharacterized protein n=1 Tax=Golovinomyces cichoracearum TaxID=62708 RepID=A0A420I2B0_9PEZI|nr:hypothetical protein GcC1_136018 [Golovinomyces cichoracearum]
MSWSAYMESRIEYHFSTLNIRRQRGSNYHNGFIIDCQDILRSR